MGEKFDIGRKTTCAVSIETVALAPLQTKTWKKNALNF